MEQAFECLLCLLAALIAILCSMPPPPFAATEEASPEALRERKSGRQRKARQFADDDFDELLSGGLNRGVIHQSHLRQSSVISLIHACGR